MEETTENISSLQRCINDLISVLALPALWTGHKEEQIVSTLLEALIDMLRLDFAYARLGDPISGSLIEVVRHGHVRHLAVEPRVTGQTLNDSLGADPRKWPRLAKNPFGDGSLSIVQLGCGRDGEIGVIVAGSPRNDFPRETETVLLSVAANQASIGLQEAWRLTEQKQTANQLEKQVAERTEGLAAANEKLIKSEAALHKALDEIKKSEAKLRQVIDTIPTTAWTARPDGYCDFLNQVWLEYAGITAEQAQGWGWAEAIHPDDREQLVEEWQSSLASGIPVDTEARIRRFDGSYRWFLIRANPLKNEAGNTLKWYGTCIDIDDRKKAEEALNRAHSELAHVARVATLNALTASIAHEINQPLASLVTNASICLRRLNAEPPNVEGARETVMRTIRDGNRAADVIARLRGLYTKKEFMLEPLDLNAAAREVIALSSSDLQRNRVILKSELADGLPLVNGDRVQLQQVVLNLVRNASDAMALVEDRPRELLIRTERDRAGRVRLSVKDVGHGFTPEAADKLFQAFYTTKTEGMGIGLHVSQSIIEAHHGRLWATANDGPGATFSFVIACQPEGLEDVETHSDRTSAA
jgi:PAS domain S-box-containing protein